MGPEIPAVISLLGEGLQLLGEGLQMRGEELQLLGEGLRLLGEGLQLLGVETGGSQRRADPENKTNAAGDKSTQIEKKKTQPLVTLSDLLNYMSQ